MKKPTKKQIERGKIIKKWGKRIFIIFLILFFYQCGVMYGFITGLNTEGQKHGRTICDILGAERDSDGFCILGEGKYRWYMDCGYEKFKIVGNQKVPFLLNLGDEIRRIILYPALRC